MVKRRGKKLSMDVISETGVTEHTKSFLPAAAPSETAIVQRLMGEFLASTTLSALRSDVGALSRDFSQFKDNIARLNMELGTFREKAILPVLAELKYLRFNMGARTEDNIGAMSKLVHHLEAQIELLLKSRGINPHAVDGAGETVLDKMGLPPDRPDYQTLEREGVPLVEGGSPLENEVEMLRAQNAKLLALLTNQSPTFSHPDLQNDAPEPKTAPP